jgi:DNA gyrase subunit A
VKEINELAGPGRGVTVIKVPAGDQVIAFLCTTDKEQTIELESSKGGKKLSLGVKSYELAARGGKGREMVKKDKVKVAHRPIAFVPLPEAKTEEPALPATGGGRRPQHRKER